MKRCPSCQANYPDDAAWCPIDRTQLIDSAPVAAPYTPGAVTAGWDVPDVPAMATHAPPATGPAPFSPPSPGAVTAGWDIPEMPAETPAAPAFAPTRPGAVTAGWDVPDMPDSAPPASPATPFAAPRPGAVTAGWDVPAMPDAGPVAAVTPMSAAALAAAAAASPFRPGEKIVSPSATLPGFAPPQEIQALLIAQRAKQLAAARPQPSDAPLIDPVYTQQIAAQAPPPGTAQPAAGFQAPAPSPAATVAYGLPQPTPDQHAPYQAAPHAAPQVAPQVAPQLAPQAAPQASPHPPSARHAHAPEHTATSGSLSEAPPRRSPVIWIVFAIVVIGAIVTAIVLAMQ